MKTQPKSGNPRRKGHNFERLICKYIREHLGHDVKTTRECSKTLDNCGVDIIGTDTLLQCKAGYDRNRPKYEEIHSYIRTNLAKQYNENHIIHKYPIMLIHNIDVGRGNRRGPEHTTVTMTLEDYVNMRNGDILPVLQIL